MSADKKLFQIRSFYIALIIPVVLSIIATIVIIMNENNLRFNLTHYGFNNIFTIFRFPLAILAIIFPAVALVAANHRSVQSSKQINLARGQITKSNAQNIFQNYYTHIDMFESYCKELPCYKDSAMLRLASPRLYHNKIYPRAKEGMYDFNREHLVYFNRRNRELIEKARVFLKLEFAESILGEQKFDEEIKPYIEQSKEFTDYCDNLFSINPSHHDIEDLITASIDYFTFISHIVAFDVVIPVDIEIQPIRDLHDRLGVLGKWDFTIDHYIE